jgi:hypothetical protein
LAVSSCESGAAITVSVCLVSIALTALLHLEVNPIVL